MGLFGGVVGGGGEGGSTTIINTPASHVVDTIADRDALNAIKGAVVYVEDATADPTVQNGFATYIKLASSWVKIADKRMLEMQGLTEQDVQAITQVNEDVQAIKEVLDESSFVHINTSPPTDKTMLWVDDSGI